MERTLESADEFQEVREIIGRYDTLKQTHADLLGKQVKSFTKNYSINISAFLKQGASTVNDKEYTFFFYKHILFYAQVVKSDFQVEMLFGVFFFFKTP